VVQAALSGGVEDELLGGAVDVGCALQQGRAGDAEAVQSVLDRAGQFAGLDREGWFGGGRALEAGAGIAALWVAALAVVRTWLGAPMVVAAWPACSVASAAASAVSWHRDSNA
jgi:hypothetical protein